MIETRHPAPDAVYERLLDASLERIWENVLDWEHLPWLHSQAFSSVSMHSGDQDGWRGEVGLAGMAGAVAGIDVALDRANLRYLNRTVSGFGEGTGILTHLFPKGPRTTAIRVEFFFPWAPREAVAGIGEVYRSLYVGLWDQDEEMMRGRQAVLDAAAASREAGFAGLANAATSHDAATPGGTRPRLPLGHARQLAAKLPMDVVLAGRPIRLLMVEGRVLAFNTRCPHLGGPLREVVAGTCEADAGPPQVGVASVEAGAASCVVACPWHGYRFDLLSGACLDGRRLRLVGSPVVEIDDATGEAALLL